MNLKKILLLLGAVCLIVLFFYFDLKRFLNLETLKANRELLVQYYAAHEVTTVAAFLVIYILQTALSLPGAAILSLAAGAVFGSILGTVYAVIAATIGATLAFLATRYLLRDAVIEKFGAKLEGMNRELEARGVNYLLFVRLVPFFPFFLINLAAGLTRLPLRVFVLGTLVGIIPGGFVFVNAGASLAAINSVRDVASPRIAGSFVLLAIFALIPALYGKLKQKERSTK